MLTDATSFYESWSSRMSKAKSLAPETAKGFGSLYQATMKAAAISVVEKELVALAIGMAVRCEPCIYVHAEKARRAGATREQIMEAAGVAVMMQGGPTYTYLPRLVDALDAIDQRESEEAAGSAAATITAVKR